MTDLLTIDAGTLTASADDRTVTGLLVPYGEECRSNLGKFSVSTGAFTIPADHSVMGFNREHAREDVLGRATSVRETPEGIVATFSVAKTPEGDQALADVAAGRMKHLSAEVANVVIRAGKAVGGRLFGGALVQTPAFPSATLLAAAEDTEEVANAAAGAEINEPKTTTEKSSEEFTDEDGKQWVRTTTTTTVIDGTNTTITTKTEIEEPEEPETPAEEEAPVATATVPGTLNATGKTETPKTVNEVMTMLAAKHAGAADSTMLAALSDIKITGTGAVGSAIQQPQWLGELWDGKSYVRRVIPLLGHADLTSFKITGWRWTTKPTMDKWAGNKTEIPSNAPKTEAYEAIAQRFAGGHDHAREFVDFTVPGYWESYYRAMTESYAKLSDDDILAKLVNASKNVVRGTTPAGVSIGMTQVIDGALSIIEEGLPSFAIVAPDIYRDILLTRNDDTLAYFNAALGLEEGTVQSFKVIPHSGVGAGKSLVGSSSAATVHEFGGGTPIRTEALDMVKGGQDTALFGYAGLAVHNPGALALVSNPA